MKELMCRGMAWFTFNIRGAWEVVGAGPRPFGSLGDAQSAAAALIVQLQGDYPGAYWATLPWGIEIVDEGGRPLSMVEAPAVAPATA